MNCEDCKDFIDAYLDDELDPASVILVRRHLQGCPECRQLLDGRKSLRDALAAPELRFDVPESLRAQVLAALPGPSPVKARPRFGLRWPVRPLFLVPWALAAIVLSVGLALFYQRAALIGSGEHALVQEVISNHIRSLLATHLLDVPSSDRHTVKPWFAGKLEFSPPVRDYAEHGFSLIGGRLDYVDRREVAALVYRHDKHFINLFIWPSPADHRTPVQGLTEKGYNVVHWEKDGFTFWAISDVSMQDLQALADLQMQPS